MTCTGRCGRYRAASRRSGRAWEDGAKWCRHCSEYVAWEGTFCPCCNRMLRRGPRKMASKLRIGTEVRRI